MKFGAALSTQDVFGEPYVLIAPNALLASGQNLYTVGSYTMPFTGYLMLDLFGEIATPAGVSAPQNFLSVGSTSTPAPTNTGDMGVCQRMAGFGGTKTSRTWAYWASLSQGTVVTAVARVYSTQNAVSTVKRIGGFWRASAL